MSEASRDPLLDLAERVARTHSEVLEELLREV
jgi:hypothetical protein